MKHGTCIVSVGRPQLTVQPRKSVLSLSFSRIIMGYRLLLVVCIRNHGQHRPQQGVIDAWFYRVESFKDTKQKQSRKGQWGHWIGLRMSKHKIMQIFGTCHIGCSPVFGFGFYNFEINRLSFEDYAALKTRTDPWHFQDRSTNGLANAEYYVEDNGYAHSIQKIGSLFSLVIYEYCVTSYLLRCAI